MKLLVSGVTGSVGVGLAGMHPSVIGFLRSTVSFAAPSAFPQLEAKRFASQAWESPPAVSLCTPLMLPVL